MIEEVSSIFPKTQLVYATFWQRLGAVLIDVLILMIPQQIILNFVGGQNIFYEVFFYHEYKFWTIFGYSLCIAVSWLYYAIMTASEAQATVGKQALKLKVTTYDNKRITFRAATVRYFAQFLSAITLLIGYFMMLWDNKNQTLHDKLAGTIVTKEVINF